MTLRGKRVLLTRARHQAAPLAALLRERGATPLLYPCLAVAPLPDYAELDAALRQAAAGHIDWLLLTSANSARALAQRLRHLGLELPQLKVAAMGAAAAATVQDLPGARLCVRLPAADRAGLADALRLRPATRVLLPQSDLAPSATGDALRRSGADLRAIVAWRNRPGSGGVDLPAALQQRRVDGLLFTSASIVRHALTRLRDENGDPDRLRALPCACLGRPTAAAARAAGFQRVELAADHSLSALLDALARHWHTAAPTEPALPS